MKVKLDMKRTLLGLAIACAPLLAHAGCEDNFAKWTQQLQPGRSLDEQRPAVCKTWPANEALTIAALPLSQPGNTDAQGTDDLEVLVANTATGAIVARRTGAKRRWSAVDPGTGRVASRELPADLAGEPCLSDDELRYLCEKAREIEAAEGVPQDVEWVIAKHLPFPDSVFFLQHRPETSWSTPPQTVPPAPEGGFDPVKYALRNVFKVPGT